MCQSNLVFPLLAKAFRQNEKPFKLFMIKRIYVQRYFFINESEINIALASKTTVLIMVTATVKLGDEIPFESNHFVFDARRVTNHENKRTKCYQHTPNRKTRKE